MNLTCNILFVKLAILLQKIEVINIFGFDQAITVFEFVLPTRDKASIDINGIKKSCGVEKSLSLYRLLE
jgi:hypothetical protein